nr:MAG TPA: hypothetical protein [Caudoviricetes sp.]
MTHFFLLPIIMRNFAAVLTVLTPQRLAFPCAALTH